MQKNILLIISFIVLAISTLSAQERLNNKGFFLKMGISSYNKVGNKPNGILGELQKNLGTKAGFFIEKAKEDAKIGWRGELGLRLDGFRVYFPAIPEFNLPETQASDFGLRSHLTNFILYRPINPLRIGVGIETSLKLMNYKSVHFKTWGYQTVALGYVGNISYDLNKKIAIEATFCQENILPTIYEKSSLSLGNQQILIGITYKI
jgi:hypothetical protein